MIFDYATLKIIWWFFISALFIIFFILGGRDFGVCTLIPFVGKNDDERRMLLNSIGPTWEGNQVWFVTAGGATFAAWPLVYATAFSGLYYALFLVLLALILRPPGMDYRSKLPKKSWRILWDCALFLSGFVPALVFGVGLGNLLLGLPFYFDENLQSHYEGGFFQLLNPFSVLFGLASVCILSLQGGIFLQNKLADPFALRVKKINRLLGWSFIALFIILGIWINVKLTGFHLQSIIDINQPLIPLTKEVMITQRGWAANFTHYPWLWLFPIITLISIFLTMRASQKDHSFWGMMLCSIAIITALGTVNATLFPFIVPSSTQPNHSLTVWDAVSSHRTLQYMFYVTVIFLPIVLAYTYWVFHVMRGKISTQETLSKQEAY